MQVNADLLNAELPAIGDVPVTFSIASGSTFPLGTTVVTASAVDAAGNTATGTFKITVRDTTAPQIVKLTASPSSLWPPNHRLVPVVLTAMVTDAADPAPKTHIISVSSNEPADEDEDERERARGDHDRDDRPPGPDWIITGDLTLKLRAEHGNRHSRRIYIITVESRDAAGNASTKTVTLAVQPREDRDDK